MTHTVDATQERGDSAKEIAGKSKQVHSKMGGKDTKTSKQNSKRKVSTWPETGSDTKSH